MPANRSHSSRQGRGGGNHGGNQLRNPGSHNQRNQNVQRNQNQQNQQNQNAQQNQQGQRGQNAQNAQQNQQNQQGQRNQQNQRSNQNAQQNLNNNDAQAGGNNNNAEEQQEESESERESEEDFDMDQLDQTRIHGSPTFGPGDELEIIHDGPGGEGERPYILYVDNKFSRRMAQIVLDQVFEQHYHLFPQKRNYDNRKFTNVFASEGPRIFNHLITACKVTFLRYLTVPDGMIYNLISDAVGRQLDIASDEYAMPYQRVLEWRKNWLQGFLRHAEAIQMDLCDRLGWQDTAPNRQLALYLDKFSASYIDQLFSQVVADQVDWRRTFSNPDVSTFYKNIFAWVMVYVHRSKIPPVGGHIIDRKTLYEHLKAIPLADAFENTFEESDYVMKPPKPAPAQRRSRTARITNPFQLDPDFHLIGYDTDTQQEEPEPNMSNEEGTSNDDNGDA